MTAIVVGERSDLKVTTFCFLSVSATSIQGSSNDKDYHGNGNSSSHVNRFSLHERSCIQGHASRSHRRYQGSVVLRLGPWMEWGGRLLETA